MTALIWKEYRNNRGAVFGGFAMTVVPYLTVVIYCLLFVLPDSIGAKEPWGPYLTLAAMCSLGLGVLLHAWIAGDIVAKERMDRSAEFMAYLPPSRGSIITSKAILALGCCLLLWLINLIVLYAVDWTSDATAVGPQWREPVILIAATAALGFGASWMGSCVFSNPTASAGLGLVAPMLWAAVATSYPHLVNANVDPAGLYTTGSLVGAPLLFVVGTIHYLRRTTP